MTTIEIINMNIFQDLCPLLSNERNIVCMKTAVDSTLGIPGFQI
jgi:hypothetical protein